MSDARITPVILSGGSGTRLWPLSREAKPKQFLALTGERTMLQLTADRVADASVFEPAIVVASERHADEIAAQLAGAHVRLILEPSARNTAPAIALAALAVDSDALLLVMPSDHLIGDAAAFSAAVGRAAPLAAQDWLVTFGIRPDRAETGYGYIQRGEELAPGVFRAERFVEKPDAARAESYVAAGDYDWNGGIFLFRAGAYLDALRIHEPAIFDACAAALADSRWEDGRLKPDDSGFAASPSRSIDHGVMEKAERIAVVPVAMDWSDLGSWDSLHETGSPDSHGNVADAGALLIDCGGCLIRTDGPDVAAIGVKDLIVIATGDAVLIVPRGESQRVKELVEALKTR